MPRNVRNAVFETNSSSSHSVTVTNDEIVETGLSKDTLRKGVIEVRPHGFGWEWKRYYTPEEKIGYLLAQRCADFISSSPEGEDCADRLKDRFDQARELLEAVEEVSGCRVAVYPPEDQDYGDSVYVDHESHGVGYELFGSRKRLAHFVLSKSSYVQTGNDNGAGPELIPTDRGTSEELHPYNYASDCDHDGAFTLWTDSMTKNVKFESGGDRIEVKAEWRDAGLIESAIRDVVIVSAKIYLKGKADSVSRAGRNMLHGYLWGFNKEGEGAFRVLRDARIEAFEGGDRRVDAHIYDTRFELRCRAPAETILKLKETISSIANWAPEEGGPRP